MLNFKRTNKEIGQDVARLITESGLIEEFMACDEKARSEMIKKFTLLSMEKYDNYLKLIRENPEILNLQNENHKKTPIKGFFYLDSDLFML